MYCELREHLCISRTTLYFELLDLDLNVYDSLEWGIVISI